MDLPSLIFSYDDVLGRRMSPGYSSSRDRQACVVVEELYAKTWAVNTRASAMHLNRAMTFNLVTAKE